MNDADETRHHIRADYDDEYDHDYHKDCDGGMTMFIALATLTTVEMLLFLQFLIVRLRSVLRYPSTSMSNSTCHEYC